MDSAKYCPTIVTLYSVGLDNENEKYDGKNDVMTGAGNT